MPEFDRDDTIRGIAHQVTVLVDERTHTEPFFTWTKARHRKLDEYVTRHRSLLDQLRAELPPSGSDTDDEGGPGNTDSRPPLTLDVLDLLLHIEAGAVDWVRWRLGRDMRDTLEDNLRLLVGASTRMNDDQLEDLGDAIHGWHATAETLTGWQSPPFTPRAACPHCETMGTLRINPEKKRGTCVACRASWDQASIGVLADHIRATDRPKVHAWIAICNHSWRLTVVSPLGISARCVACHGMETRRMWPPGTPVWDDLDGAMCGASA